MNKAVLLWAILMTILAALFVWRYEQKACIENHITNIVDTAFIYIPVGSGFIDNSGGPGWKAPKFPSIIKSGKEKRFVIMPQITLGNERVGTSIGLSAIYLRDRWSIGYTYDFMLQSHSIGFGWRF